MDAIRTRRSIMNRILATALVSLFASPAFAHHGSDADHARQQSLAAREHAADAAHHAAQHALDCKVNRVLGQVRAAAHAGKLEIDHKGSLDYEVVQALRQKGYYVANDGRANVLNELRIDWYYSR
jgi:hypothetical protein